jgi:NAD(P)-dependent dehydrogenase (short-subunit alcohol dehydrogenase family)
MKLYRGKTAIVTGGGSGIGRALALALGRAGARVAITDIVYERALGVASELKALGGDAWAYEADHSDIESTKKFADRFFSEVGSVDVLCLNAGVGHGATFERTSLQDWEWVLKTNLWGAIYMLHCFSPHLIEKKRGWVLITASIAGLLPMPGMAPYNVSKFGLVGLAETLRMEWAGHNVVVSALCPGVINTNIIRNGKIDLRKAGGASASSAVEKFYAKMGTDPSVVARHGLNGLARGACIIPTPLHAWPGYLFHRLSPSLHSAIVSLFWKRVLPFGS